jgi:hypothetical protein
MKYVHLEKDTNKILGWYSDDIHSNIPTPNIEVADEVWQEAININANCYENGEFIVKDFRTAEEILEQEQAQFRLERNQLLIEADIEINKLEDLNMDSSSWRAYRQALRDSTESWVLPTKPEGAK